MSLDYLYFVYRYMEHRPELFFPGRRTRMDSYSNYDQITVQGLEVFAKHGLLSEENTLGQKFIISAVLFCDTASAGESDDLSRSVDYAKAAALIEKEASAKIFKLLESLSEHLAKKLLLAFPKIQAVEVEVKKPWAPIGLPLETVSVKIRRKWHDIYLGIGSNMGDREKNLNEAVRMLGEDGLTRVCRVSSFIETEPVGYTEQADFLNGAVYVKSLRTPEQFLDLISEIETALKRERVIHWGPRTIDVDILLYDDAVIQTEDLTIPHIEMTKRLFVLEPLREIAVHPVSGERIVDLYNKMRKA